MQVLAAGFGAVVGSGGFPDREEQMAQRRGGEGMGAAGAGPAPAGEGGGAWGVAFERGELRGSQSRGGLHAGAVGLVALEQRLDVGHAEAAGQFFVHTLAAFAAGFDVDGTEVVALDQVEVAPRIGEAFGHQLVARDGDGAFDYIFEIALLLFGSHSEDFIGHIFAIEG